MPFLDWQVPEEGMKFVLIETEHVWIFLLFGIVMLSYNKGKCQESHRLIGKIQGVSSFKKFTPVIVVRYLILLDEELVEEHLYHQPPAEVEDGQ